MNGDGRFLRGGQPQDILMFQEDTLQDHDHSLLDSGHAHTDAGHTHSDSGHAHNYDDIGEKHALKNMTSLFEILAAFALLCVIFTILVSFSRDNAALFA